MEISHQCITICIVVYSYTAIYIVTHKIYRRSITDLPDSRLFVERLKNQEGENLELHSLPVYLNPPDSAD